MDEARRFQGSAPTHRLEPQHAKQRRALAIEWTANIDAGEDHIVSYELDGNAIPSAIARVVDATSLPSVGTPHIRRGRRAAFGFVCSRFS